MFKYARLGPVVASAPAAITTRAEPQVMIYVFDYATLKVIWWAARRRAARRLRDPRRLRSRHRHAAAVRRPHRRRAARRCSIPSGRRGKATRCGSSPPAARRSPRGRSSTRRRSPGFYVALILVAVRALPAPGRLRLPQQGRRSALAQRLGLGHLRRRLRARARVRRRVRQPAARRAVSFRRRPARRSTRDRSSAC